MQLTLRDLQGSIRSMYARKGYNKASLQTLCLGVMEEAGELAQAVLVNHTEDFTPSENKYTDTVAHEAGDLITYILAVCDKLGVQPEFDWMAKGE